MRVLRRVSRTFTTPQEFISTRLHAKCVDGQTDGTATLLFLNHIAVVSKGHVNPFYSPLDKLLE